MARISHGIEHLVAHEAAAVACRVHSRQRRRCKLDVKQVSTTRATQVCKAFCTRHAARQRHREVAHVAHKAHHSTHTGLSREHSLITVATRTHCSRHLTVRTRTYRTTIARHSAHCHSARRRTASSRSTRTGIGRVASRTHRNRLGTCRVQHKFKVVNGTASLLVQLDHSIRRQFVRLCKDNIILRCCKQRTNCSSYRCTFDKTILDCATRRVSCIVDRDHTLKKAVLSFSTA